MNTRLDRSLSIAAALALSACGETLPPVPPPASVIPAYSGATTPARSAPNLPTPGEPSTGWPEVTVSTQVPPADGRRPCTLRKSASATWPAAWLHRARSALGTLALPLAALQQDRPAETPPLIKGYLRAGAWICGEPAWDPDFNTADLPVLLPVNRFDPRYAKHFMGNKD